MDSKPLSFLGLQCVLQYVEANLRFQLSLCMPSIKSIEKKVPLKINYLSFYSNEITINETKYQLGIIKDYGVNIAPLLIQEINEEGGIPYDIDQYGLGYDRTDDVAFPGDVVIISPEIQHRRNVPTTMEERIRKDEIWIQLFEETLARRIAENIQNSKNELVLMPISYCGSPNVYLNVPGVPNEELRRMIDDMRTRLLPCYYKRDNVKPPYQGFIQFTINGKKSKKIQRKQYNTKLFEVEKQLCANLFGDRKDPIKVKCLETNCEYIILRLLVGLKFKIQGLKVRMNVSTVYEAFQSIVEESNYPLEYLEIRHIKEFDHPVVRSAKKLQISWFNSETELVGLLSLRNKDIYLKEDNVLTFPVENHISLIQNWVTNAREVGTRFVFGTMHEKTITNVEELVKQRFDGVKIGNGFITLPINDFSELKMSYGAVKDVTLLDRPWFYELTVIDTESEAY